MPSRWEQIVEAVRRGWGEGAAWDLESRGGLSGEVLDLTRDVEPRVWLAAIQRVLKEPAPRARVGAVLAKNLRLAIAEERRRLPAVDATAALETPYTRALAALLADPATPCP